MNVRLTARGSANRLAPLFVFTDIAGRAGRPSHSPRPSSHEFEEANVTDHIERRNFIKHGLAVGAGLTLAGPRALGANDRVRVAVIGCGRQGRGVMGNFLKQADAQIVALSDVYAPQLREAAAKANQPGLPTYGDFRHVLDRKDVDAVVVASPDHWHALQAVMACQAGKDVYVEKPIATTIAEGRAMVSAARKYSRVVQVGTQQRSGDHYHRAAELIRDGAIGKVTFVRTWNYGNATPDGIGNPPDTHPPDGLDWEMWLGPAPKRAFNANRFGVHPDRWSSFRWFWDYAGGMMTDWGVHHLDIVQLVMRVDAPTAVTAVGGKYLLRDNRETPDTLMVTYEYPGFLCTYENRECNAQPVQGGGWHISFHGTEGTLFINRREFEVVPEVRRVGDKPIPRMQPMQFKGESNQGQAHVRNFLDCVKSRQQPTSDIEIGHRSTTTALLGNVALRAGKRIVWNRAAEKVEGDAGAARYLAREYRRPWHLSV
jgi:predicted dehydrogenase